ncbi:hypothetical protein Vretifemale_293 [Volvox reticuliferus]|uniref:Uncharacterized protein n=1 Tax=Volvox reticuliferus TaxID=1737510 RepID=A0A8J4BVE2_9CHLO|nr:hypothetical protein Vretifemale_293 [Volvox reticuliferus]
MSCASADVAAAVDPFDASGIVWQLGRDSCGCRSGGCGMGCISPGGAEGTLERGPGRDHEATVLRRLDDSRVSSSGGCPGDGAISIMGASRGRVSSFTIAEDPCCCCCCCCCGSRADIGTGMGMGAGGRARLSKEDERRKRAAPPGTELRMLTGYGAIGPANGIGARLLYIVPAGRGPPLPRPSYISTDAVGASAAGTAPSGGGPPGCCCCFSGDDVIPGGADCLATEALIRNMLLPLTESIDALGAACGPAIAPGGPRGMVPLCHDAARHTGMP